jgi:predicted RNA binding protein YcfA (HicA-like mRNA interferase family)
MSNQKIYTGKELLSILLGIGFEVIRIKGSHHYLRHPDGRATVVPVHVGETIGKGLFGKILRDIDITREDFNSLFN